jgi:hypothetical protein
VRNFTSAQRFKLRPTEGLGMAGRILADIVVTGTEPIGLNREHELVLAINRALQSPGLRWVLGNCPQVQITIEALGAVGNDKKYVLAAVFTDAEEVQAFEDCTAKE